MILSVLKYQQNLVLICCRARNNHCKDDIVFHSVHLLTSAGINSKWLIQEHANAKSRWKHINPLQNWSLVSWFPWAHHLRASLLCPGAENMVWSKNTGTNEGSRMDFGLAFSYLVAKTQQGGRPTGGGGQWVGEKILARWVNVIWRLHVPEPWNKSYPKRVQGSSLNEQGSATCPCSVHCILNKTLSYPWHFHTTWQCEGVIKERNQPREKSISTALVCWRTVKGPMKALSWWMVQD